MVVETLIGDAAPQALAVAVQRATMLVSAGGASSNISEAQTCAHSQRCVFESRGACVENSRRCTAAPSLQRRNLLERSSLCTGRVQLGDDGIASGCCGFQGATTTLERRRDEWMKALVNETARDQLFAACAMGRLWKAPGCARGALTSTSGYMWSCCRSLRNVVGL